MYRNILAYYKEGTFDSPGLPPEGGGRGHLCILGTLPLEGGGADAELNTLAFRRRSEAKRHKEERERGGERKRAKRRARQRQKQSERQIGEGGERGKSETER